ncbi:MAG: multidrug efflux SMR transporter [Ferruginibacter sp.]
MNWMILIIAGFFEAGFAACIVKARMSSGNEAISWWAGFAICLGISMYLLYKASETLPMGTAYAVWTGVGAVATVLAGIIFFHEPAGLWRLFFISTLIVSIIGLQLLSH